MHKYVNELLLLHRTRLTSAIPTRAPINKKFASADPNLTHFSICIIASSLPLVNRTAI